MTLDEYRALTPARKPSKYRNRPVVVDGIRHDSRKEARRWADLQLLERSGKISDLKRQVVFPLDVNGHSICAYIADATYLEAGVFVVEDTKSEITRKNPVYRIKRKLLKALRGIEVRET